MEETVQTFISQHHEIVFMLFGTFFIVASWFDWDWIFAPPYNSIKNPIGFWLGRKAYRISFFIAGIVIVGLMVLVFFLKHS